MQLFDLICYQILINIILRQPKKGNHIHSELFFIVQTLKLKEKSYFCDLFRDVYKNFVIVIIFSTDVNVSNVQRIVH